MAQRTFSAALVLILAVLTSGSVHAQPAARRAAMWETYQSSRPTADKWLPAVLSYELAAQAEIKAANKANIAEERRSARQGGGVVDLRALYTYQERIREAESEIARLKGIAKSMRVNPAKATSEAVETVASCVQGGSDSTLRNEREFSADDAEEGSCFWLYLLHCELMDGERVRGWMSQTFGR